MPKLSRKLVETVKLSGTREYRIAQEAGMHPSTLSKLIHGAERVKPNDPRVRALARVLGLRPEVCFEKD